MGCGASSAVANDADGNRNLLNSNFNKNPEPSSLNSIPKQAVAILLEAPATSAGGAKETKKNKEKKDPIEMKDKQVKQIKDAKAQKDKEGTNGAAKSTFSPPTATMPLSQSPLTTAVSYVAAPTERSPRSPFSPASSADLSFRTLLRKEQGANSGFGTTEDEYMKPLARVDSTFHKRFEEVTKTCSVSPPKFETIRSRTYSASLSSDAPSSLIRLMAIKPKQQVQKKSPFN